MTHHPPRTLPADPATTAALLRPRVTSRDADVAERAYVTHWTDCPVCHAASEASAMCAQGRHLLAKLRQRQTKG